MEHARFLLGRKVAFQAFLDVLTDPERIEMLKVRMTLEKDNPVHQLVGVVHLLDAFLARLLG